MLIILLALPARSISQESLTNRNMTKWTGRRLSKLQMTKLLSGNHYKDLTFKYEIPKLPIQRFYLLHDRRFVIKSLDGSGVIFPSEQDYQALTGEVEKNQITELPNNFLETISLNIDKLSKLTNLKLDSSQKLENLRAIDSVIRNIGWQNLDLNIWLGPMIAYCGQIVVNETGGKWLKQGDDYDVKLPDASILSVSHLVRKDFVNTPADISFYGVFHSQIYPILQRKLSGN